MERETQSDENEAPIENPTESVRPWVPPELKRLALKGAANGITAGEDGSASLS